MLRSLPGVMTDFVKINEEVLAKRVGVPLEKLQKQLKTLDDYQFLTYLPRNDKPQVLFLSEFVDTKHFNLSKENYHSRKKDAEARVKAVIDFVNNDEECRSVQLLRYFNEETCQTCGQCDVCQKQGKNRVPYGTIEEKLRSVMREESQSVREVLSKCGEYDDAKVLEPLEYRNYFVMKHEKALENYKKTY